MPIRSGNHSILRNASYLYVGKASAQALRMIYLLALAKVLGPELFGYLTYAHFWLLLLLPLANFGTARLLAQRVGANQQDARRILEEILALRLLSLLVAFLLSLTLSLWLPNDDLTRRLLLIYSATLAIRSVAMWTEHAFVALQSGKRVFQMDILFRSAETVVGLCALSLNVGIEGIAFIHLLSWAGQAAFGWVTLRRAAGRLRPRWEPDVLRSIAAAGAAFMSTALALSVIERSGLVIVDALAVEPAHLGQLAFILQALSVFLMAPKSIAMAALPVLSGQVAEGERGEKHTVLLLLRAAVVGAAAIALAVSLLAPLILPWLLGDEYAMAIRWLGVVTWLLVPLSTASLLNQLVTAHGRFWAAASSGVVSALVMLAVLIFLDGQNSILRVVLASFLGATTWTLLDVRLARRAGWINPGKIFARPGAALFASLTIYYLFEDSLPWLAWALATAMLIPGLGRLGALLRMGRSLLTR